MEHWGFETLNAIIWIVSLKHNVKWYTNEAPEYNAQIRTHNSGKLKRLDRAKKVMIHNKTGKTLKRINI